RSNVCQRQFVNEVLGSALMSARPSLERRHGVEEAMKKEVEVTGTLKITDKLDIIELLVRQVSALVATTADVVEVSSKDTFAIEAWLYRTADFNGPKKANREDEGAAEQKRSFASQP